MEALVGILLEKNNFFRIQSVFYRNLLARVGAYYCFVLEGVFMGVWGRYLPSIQTHVGLSDSLLGTSVLFVYLSTVLVGPFVAWLLHRCGSRTTAMIGAAGFISALPLISIPNDLGPLICAMMYYGAFMGIMDISMNNCAILTEIVAGKPLLGSFHGSYSVAAALGSVLGGLYIQYGLTTTAAFVATSLVGFLLSASTSVHMYDREQELRLTAYHERPQDPDELSKRLLSSSQVSETYNALYEEERETTEFHSLRSNTRLSENNRSYYNNNRIDEEIERPTPVQYETQRVAPPHIYEMEHPVSDTSFLPVLADQEEAAEFSWEGLYKARKVIAYFSAVGFLAAFGESGIVTWSVVFFERSIPSSSVIKSLGLTSFMVCMAVGRFFCDYLRGIFGRRKIIRVGGLLAVAGLSLVVVSVDTPIPALFACMGFAVTGLGLSTIIPIVFSSAGHLPGVHAGTAIATVATASYSGSIVSSPLIGVVSDLFGSLRFALLCDAILLGMIFFLSWGIIEETEVFKPRVNQDW